jgi:hypothetical protein
MGMKSPINETNTSLMGQEPTKKLSFDVYRVELSKDGGSNRLELSNVISWELMALKTTKEELKGLADFIYKYLENN